MAFAGSVAGDEVDGVDVLHEVELLVAGGGPEVLPVVGEALLLLAAFLGGDGDLYILSTETEDSPLHVIALIGLKGVFDVLYLRILITGLTDDFDDVEPQAGRFALA